jgi:hypothetical protein
MAEDKEIAGTDIFWRASKSQAYRALIREVFKTLVAFLQRNRLVTRELLPDGGEVDENFIIRRSDLTDEGWDFYRRVEQRWFNAIDRGVAPSNTNILEKTLREMRAGS